MRSSTAILESRFGNLLQLLVGKHGAVFADIVRTDVAATALADAARHLPFKRCDNPIGSETELQ